MGKRIIESIKSDPLKWLPIGISVLALLISFMGWWEAHRGRLINEEINRPVLKMRGVSMETHGKYDQSPYGVIKAKVTNPGKSTAKVTSFHFMLWLDKGPSNCGERDIKIEAMGLPESVLAGAETTFSATFLVTGECRNAARVDFHVDLLVTYTDPVSGMTYSQTLVLPGLTFEEK